ncbi:MAG: SxtJ family membrane protein [Verrucomicrobiota bacterium]|nr:SxtJ family membrane protein [Verrucomicrobiota bacterium]
MTWADIQRNPSIKTLRQFAGIWLVFFLALAAYQGWYRSKPGWGLGLAVLAVVVGGPGLLFPRILRPIYVGWMMLVFPIGWVVSQIMLLLMFYGIITPIAFVLRLKRRDPLCRKRAPDRPSFWMPKETPADLRRYFRQY